uniref:ShKT domain-containing protein n=1 Tax=Ascaris lumbricoides TaxID=6252 RepID=A0A9J2PIU1_ASCLU
MALIQRTAALWAMFLVTFAQEQFQRNCDDAATAAEREVCIALQRNARFSRPGFQRDLDNDIRTSTVPEHLQPAPVAPGSRGQIATHPYECMTINCLCPYFRIDEFKGRIGPKNECILEDGQLFTMAYRKEYRMLSEEERIRYHNAMAILKRSGEFDRMCVEHFNVGLGSGAHSGPGFLPWHREFLKRAEIALRLIDPTVSLPYWDTVMDNYLVDPRDSIFFSPLFVGEVDQFGNVITGPYAFWTTMEGRNAIVSVSLHEPSDFSYDGYILRLLLQMESRSTMAQEGFLLSEAHIASVVEQIDVEYVLAYTAPLQVVEQIDVEYVLAYTAPLQGCPFPENANALEFVHAFVHLWIGGHMRDPPTSANDPIFYVFHAFIDLIWEMWRQSRQLRDARELDYPPDLPQCADPQHFGYAPMRPYDLINRDGLSNLYTDQMYRYAPRPSCSFENPNCGSPYLFCDLRGVPHCVSKVKINGICTGFEGFDACFDGICEMGRCVPGTARSVTRSDEIFNRKIPFIAPVQLSAVQRRQVSQTEARHRFVSCFNRDPCCDRWARHGECRSKKNYMQQFCAASCAFCTSDYNVSNDVHLRAFPSIFLLGGYSENEICLISAKAMAHW